MGNRAALETPQKKVLAYYTDITDNLDVNPLTGQLALVTNEHDVAASYRRLILLAASEREYESLGGNIHRYLFELPSDHVSLMIKNQIEMTTRAEPRAVIQDLIVNYVTNMDAYIITLTFTMINIINPTTINVVLRRVR